MALKDGTQWQKANYLLFLLLVVGSLEKPLHGHIEWIYQQIVATLQSNLTTKKTPNVRNNVLQFNHAAADSPICSSTILSLIVHEKLSTSNTAAQP